MPFDFSQIAHLLDLFRFILIISLPFPMAWMCKAGRMPWSLLRSVEDAIHPAGSPLVLLHGCVHAQKVPVAWICTAGSPCPMAMLGGKCRDATILGMKGKPQGCLNLSVSQAPPDVPMDPPHQLVFP